ncbi:2-amino-4-hydroxy-6-hydroxymethyldihydropteridinediphosphokinase [Modicisalibacter ilicicola DSM 19980]|uniref:2-amino-4-hydroxy-6-hydroxymethyldihydropteridine diphosphokinase n=1 Tax=Modicisalibacter ilicicola DSM 19980 TaxID=1121942 RepID=A0A1M4UDX9_9GAMM|nr:2-amino-4-hydroxy-6-hydroxymethyldihydropteridine diphosphokinase [Halomonas ilicicola]SHE54955.1 2-amino-4-hydroxy-6-hydroxymethyldihydropteridinediphosphokinase [Halomonas ilicicola DSM 19980]
MTQVVVGIGSHVECERHVRACLDALAAEFGELRISRVFESEPVGAPGNKNVYNLVVAFDSRASVGELKAWCKRTERANGRIDRGPVTLDIDLLGVGDRRGTFEGVSLPHDDILRFAFVLRPLAELLPDARHPITGQRYAELWAGFDPGQQRLWPVDFTWRGQVISKAD